MSETETQSECSKLKGRLLQICEGTSGLPIWEVNKYRKAWGLEPISLKDQKRSAKYVTCGSSPNPKHGPGKELLAVFQSAGVPSCQQCKTLADKMDLWGVHGCRAKIDLIVDDMEPRAKKWISERAEWIPKLLPVISEAVSQAWGLPMFAVAAAAKLGYAYGIPDAALREGLRVIVLQAIQTAEQKQIARQTRHSQHRGASGAGRPVGNKPAVFPDAVPPIVRIIPAIRTAARKQPTLARTVESLKAGGFESPMVFAEPDSPVNDAEYCRWPKQLKPFRSFVEMSKRLLRDFPGQWYLLCEDDVEFQQGVADRLRGLKIDKDVVFTLYMSQRQQVSAQEFSELEGDVHGSLAYLVHANSLQKITESETCAKWNNAARVDRFVPAACSEASVKFVAHYPSLCQHIGSTSTLNPQRKLDASRISTFQQAMPDRGLVTLITPTGDRPVSFAMCERWISQQRYQGPTQWIVIDDGKTPTAVTMDQEYVRLNPMLRQGSGPYANHSLCRNLQAALPLIRGERIIFIEDDEYYGPDYLSVMMSQLQQADMVGEFGAKYYYVPQQMWRHHVDSENHASLCRTGINRNVLPLLDLVTANTTHPSVDLRLWEQWDGSKIGWRDHTGTDRLGVGLKGMPGRKSYGHRPSPAAFFDPDYAQLRKWVGDDAEKILECVK